MNKSIQPPAATERHRVQQRSRREKAVDVLIAMAWAIYATAYLQKAVTQRHLASLGLFIFYSLVVWLFVSRAPAKRTAPWPITLVALFDMALPVLGLRPSPDGVSILGSVIQGASFIGMLLSAVSLGQSFAIAPADRGLRTNGPYRWLRHPLYASELLFYMGYLLANLSWRNLAVFGISLSLTFIRIHYEERMIEGYDQYAQNVRWRLIPFVW